MSNGMKIWILGAVLAVFALATIDRGTVSQKVSASEQRRPGVSATMSNAPDDDALARHWRYRRRWWRYS